MLELEEKFKVATGQYFAMDVYGGGKDEKEIKIAFFGRHGTSRATSSISQESDSSSVVAAKEADQKAAAVFGSSSSLRDQLCGSDTTEDDDYVLVVNTDQEAEEDNLSCSTPGNVTPPDASTSVAVLLATPNVEDVEMLAEAEKTTDQLAAEISNGAPLEVLGDLSGKTLITSADTADATLKLIESVMKAGFSALAGVKDAAKTRDGGEGPPSPKKALPFHIAPAKTRFKVCPVLSLLAATL